MLDFRFRDSRGRFITAHNFFTAKLGDGYQWWLGMIGLVLLVCLVLVFSGCTKGLRPFIADAAPTKEMSVGEAKSGHPGAELAAAVASEHKIIKPAGESAAEMRKTARRILVPIAWLSAISAVLGGVACFFLPIIPRKAVAGAAGAFVASLLLLYAVDRYGPLFAEITVWASVALAIATAIPWIIAHFKRNTAKASEAKGIDLIIAGHADAGVAMLAESSGKLFEHRKRLLALVSEGVFASLDDASKRRRVASLIESARKDTLPMLGASTPSGGAA